MKTASFAIPLRDRQHGRLRPPSQLAHVGATLARTFGGYSSGSGKGYWRDAEDNLVEDNLQVYEVAFPDRGIEAVGDCARRFATLLGEPILVKIVGETYIFDRSGVRSGFLSTAAETRPPQWPRQFDIAVQTVIGSELHAVQDHFGIDAKRDLRSVQGSLFYKGKATSASGQGETSVVVYCQATAGSDAAAIAAERLIGQWKPKAVFLMGIAAGRRNKVKIGDVVTPRVVVDDTPGVAEAARRLKRTRIFAPPHAMTQQLQNYRLDREKWYDRLLRATPPPKVPRGKARLYQEHVARRPALHEAAIYSSNLLLRDPNVLETHAEETHQQIKVGEMEAAGFGHACGSRDRPVPWWIVRGVSDFGDEFKDDQFHMWAANAAASYLLGLIEDGIRVDLLKRPR